MWWIELLFPFVFSSPLLIEFVDDDEDLVVCQKTAVYGIRNNRGLETTGATRFRYVVYAGQAIGIPHVESSDCCIFRNTHKDNVQHILVICTSTDVYR